MMILSELEKQKKHLFYIELKKSTVIVWFEMKKGPYSPNFFSLPLHDQSAWLWTKRNEDFLRFSNFLAHTKVRFINVCINKDVFQNKFWVR